MSSEEAVNLTAEDRLKALTYQFVKLYERWAEDRQVLNKHLAYQAEMLKNFTLKVKEFSELTPQVQKQLIASIKQEAQLVAEQIGTKVSETATAEVNKNVEKFSEVIKQATATLNSYKTQADDSSLVFTVLMPFVVCVIVTLAIVWLLLPKPTLPFTGEQFKTYQNGEILAEFWPKLSKKEQSYLMDLANAPVTHSVSNNINKTRHEVDTN